MPEHARTLVIILFLATIVFAFARIPICMAGTAPSHYVRRRNLWFAVTLIVFLSHNFWIYLAATAVLLLVAARREPNTLAMFFVLLFAVPPIGEEIPGFGLVNFLFKIDYYRLLALTVLLPAFIHLQSRPQTQRFGSFLPDKFLLAYLILIFVLLLTKTTFTNALRQGIFYAFIDIFLPYYVASRYVRSVNQFTEVLFAFVLAALILSAVSVFEYAKGWLLYPSLSEALGVPWVWGSYLFRESNLRAQGTAGHAIPLGYALAVALGLAMYVRSRMDAVPWRWAIVLLLAGLLASLSRGPWIGAMAMVLLFIGSGPFAAPRLAKGAIVVALASGGLLLSPVGEKFISYLPFVGTVSAETVLYRQRLLEISVGVILDSPLFGGTDFYRAYEMQELVQGQGIIDVVNTYLGVGLTTGLFGLSLFAGFFASVAFTIYRGIKRFRETDEEHTLGRALLCTLIGILVMIFTVSSVTLIPVIYWSIAGLGVTYARLASVFTPKVAPFAASHQQGVIGHGLGQR